MAGELDQVSEAIGEMKGIMRSNGEKMDRLERKFDRLESQVIDLHTNGCARGRSNGHRIEQLEDENQFKARKDWGKLSAAATVISGVVAFLAEMIRRGAQS